MASVGPTGSQVNAQFANQLARGGGAIGDNLRAQSGVTGAQAKGAKREKKGIKGDDSGLSEAAQRALKSDQANHAEHTAQHGQEMAKQVGIDTDHDRGERTACSARGATTASRPV